MASLDEEEAGVDTEVFKDYVKLISKEGHEFVASKECCLASGTIRTLLTGPGLWKETEGPIPTIHFEEMSTAVLEKVIQYFYYKKKYDHTAPPLPHFKIDVESIVPLILAANFLDT
mmetsp:Transcript_29990/g.41864  ORF Transcript_29990/g.41864 Transcript_29990/m.41864 type:complete len:116 (-) Transcript_29990:328-675(-)